MTWTDDPWFLPEAPEPRKRPKKHRHNREFLSVLARSVSGRQYLAERLNYTDRTELAKDIASGQIYDACAVFAWNPVEGWARDISEEIAFDIHQRYRLTRSSAAFLADYITWGN